MTHVYIVANSLPELLNLYLYKIEIAIHKRTLKYWKDQLSDQRTAGLDN